MTHSRIPSLCCFAAVLAAVGGGAWLRLADLGNRPMHCDEANQALKFGHVLQKGWYDYDPREHHGPSLGLLTLPVARAAGAHDLAELTETHLRLVPALFGVALVALAWLARGAVGLAAAAWAALLAAVSPAMVFYSRYYIQETLLVCFTFGAIVALWRFARPDDSAGDPGARRLRLRRAAWLAVLGACLGMMHASKETCAIAMAALVVAAVAALPDLRRLGPRRLVLSCLAAAAVAAGVSALFFSSFGRHPQGVTDSYLTYGHYLRQAWGEGSAGDHRQPFLYYFRVLFAWREPDGDFWTEGAVAALALVGLAAAVLRRGLDPRHVSAARFLAVYTLAMTLVYSAISYKTPWCALGFLHGMILLAGVGAAALVRFAPGGAGKAVVVALLLGAGAHLAWQAHRASFVAVADPTNPYLYSPTAEDVPRLAERVRRIAACHPDGRAMHVQVICPDGDFWPLPWYLRDFSRVGWFASVPRVWEGPAAPLIITQPEPAVNEGLMHYLYVAPPPGERPLYMPGPPGDEDARWQLRPRVPLQMYLRLDLWEACAAEG